MKLVDYNGNDISLFEMPVGSVLITTTNTNPSTFTNGTWKLIEKNNPIYMITGTKILTGNGTSRLLFDTVSNVQNLFYTNYGFRPDIMNETNINFINGDADATDRGVLGADISAGSTNINISLNAAHSGAIRINYSFAAKDRSVVQYKWKRTV